MTDSTSDARFDVLLLLLQRWRTLLVFALLGGGISVAYVLLAPEWYTATLTVVQSQRSESTLALSLASKLPDELDTMSTDVQRIKAVLTSTSVSDAVIDKFGLQERYRTKHREHARKALWEHCATSVDKKAGVVSLECEDKDPAQAMAMATYFGEVGNKVFGRVSVSSAREERKFLEAQVDKARADVDDASRKLREFQEEHKVIDLPEQSKAVISAMASLQGEMLSKQLELSYLTSFSSGTESSVVQLQKQIRIMRAQLEQLEVSRGSAPARPQDLGSGVAAAGSAAGSGSNRDSNGTEFFPDAMAVPELRFELEQLLRQQTIAETVFFMMTQRHEMAKVDEARDTSAFQILDYPTMPTYRSRPKRTRIVLSSLVASLALGSLWIVGPVWWRRRMMVRP